MLNITLVTVPDGETVITVPEGTSLQTVVNDYNLGQRNIMLDHATVDKTNYAATSLDGVKEIFCSRPVKGAE